jgi:hypothetical protein
VDLVLVILWIVYFLPFALAMRNEHPHWVLILIANGLLGWTGVGWIACWLWARAVPIEPEPAEPLARRAHLRLLPGGAAEAASNPTRSTARRDRAASDRLRDGSPS